jgi:hypothetical protein
MGVTSMPKWLESIFDSKYPNWKEVEHNEDGSARYMPAGLRTLEAALLRSREKINSPRKIISG